MFIVELPPAAIVSIVFVSVTVGWMVVVVVVVAAAVVVVVVAADAELTVLATVVVVVLVVTDVVTGTKNPPGLKKYLFGPPLILPEQVVEDPWVELNLIIHHIVQFVLCATGDIVKLLLPVPLPTVPHAVALEVEPDTE